MQLDIAPNFCYKYLESKVHAERMLEGYVWLSTVVDIRTCDRTRADAGELILQYGLDGFNNKNTDKAKNITRKTLAEMGFDILPGGEFSGSGGNVKVVRNHSNAFLFCATESKPTKKLARLFGSNCVGINDPERFWFEVTTELKKLHTLVAAEYGRAEYVDKRNAKHGNGVEYSSVIYTCPIENKDEKEVRFFWALNESEGIKPFELHVPKISKLCDLISF